MNKSIPTLLGIVIILLVVVLVVLIIHIRITQGIARGERIVGTKGGELLTGEKAPTEYIDETSALGDRGDQSEPQLSPAMRPDSRAGQRRQEAAQRRGTRRSAETSTPPGE